MSHKSEMAGPFNRGYTIIKKHFYFYRYLQKADDVPGDPGAGPFWPQGHNLNKLGGGPLVDAINQISRL